VESVDFVYQAATDFGASLSNYVAADAAINVQLTDLNPGTLLVQANSQALIASAALNIDFTNNVGSYHSDLFPDNFGP